MVVYKDSQALSARLIFGKRYFISKFAGKRDLPGGNQRPGGTGDGIWQRKQLFSYKGDFSKPNVTFASLSFERTGRIIESAGLK